MGKFRVTIEGTIQARNKESAFKKMDALKERVGKTVDGFEWHIAGEKSKTPDDGNED